jgi:hypothetical protein
MNLQKSSFSTNDHYHPHTFSSNLSSLPTTSCITIEAQLLASDPFFTSLRESNSQSSILSRRSEIPWWCRKLQNLSSGCNFLLEWLSFYATKCIFFFPLYLISCPERVGRKNAEKLNRESHNLGQNLPFVTGQLSRISRALLKNFKRIK